MDREIGGLLDKKIETIEVDRLPLAISFRDEGGQAQDQDAMDKWLGKLG